MFKRGREETYGSNTKKPRRVETEGNRFAIGPRVPGIIIGKGGARVKKIREEAGANVSIGKGEVNQDCVMTITGDSAQTATACLLIAREINAYNESAPADRQAPADFRLLVHKGHAGAILGKGGSTITQIMADSSARVRLSNDPLPNSTDKACFIVGTPEQIQSAVQLVIDKVTENPLREGTKSMPYLSALSALSGATGGLPEAYAAAAALPFGAAAGPFPQAYGGYAMGASPYDQQYSLYGSQPSYGAPGISLPNVQPMQGVGATPDEFVLMVPSKCGGAIIGKGGATVNSIKQASACNVSVGKPDQEGLSAVKVRGAPEQMPVALSMVMQACQNGGVELQQTQQTISIPGNCTGAVIGKKGQRIKDMNTVSSCRISLAEELKEDGTRAVSITGHTIGIQIATYLVNAACSKQQEGVQSMDMSGGSETQQQLPHGGGARRRDHRPH